MDDVKQRAQPLEGVELALLLGRQGTGTCLGGEFVHERVVTLGKPQLE